MLRPVRLEPLTPLQIKYLERRIDDVDRHARESMEALEKLTNQRAVLLAEATKERERRDEDHFERINGLQQRLDASYQTFITLQTHIEALQRLRDTLLAEILRVREAFEAERRASNRAFEEYRKSTNKKIAELSAFKNRMLGVMAGISGLTVFSSFIIGIILHFWK